MDTDADMGIMIDIGEDEDMVSLRILVSKGVLVVVKTMTDRRWA